MLSLSSGGFFHNGWVYCMPICGLTSYEVEAFLTAVVSVAPAQTSYVRSQFRIRQLTERILTIT